MKAFTVHDIFKIAQFTDALCITELGVDIQTHFSNHSELFTCLYKLFLSLWLILSPSKLFTFPPESSCVVQVIGNIYMKLKSNFSKFFISGLLYEHLISWENADPIPSVKRSGNYVCHLLRYHWKHFHFTYRMYLLFYMIWTNSNKQF